MTREDLKPCPFCGAPANLWEWNGGVRIDCSNWDAADENNTHMVGVGARTRDDAIKLWNRRC